MDVESVEALIEQCGELVGRISRRDCYLDLLYDNTSVVRVFKSRTEEKVVIRPLVEGFVLRGYKGGQWREVGVQTLEEVSAAITRFERWQTPSKAAVELREFESWQVNQTLAGAIPLEDVPIDQKVEDVRALSKDLQQQDVRVVNPIVVYSEAVMERIFVNNEGCILRQRVPRVRIFLQPIVKEGSRMEFDYLSVGGEVGYELMKGITGDQIQQVVEDSVALLQADKAPAGTMPVIVDHDMAGLIAHESFGHGLEADQILRDRSYLKPLLGKPVASEICNISDSPVEGGALGSFLFDDEGIRPQKTRLVENGVLTHVLHDRYTASALGGDPRGNGRRESYAHKLHVRMTNTFFEPGDWSVEEMVEDLNVGVMLVRGYFGMEDPIAGGMQVTSKKGYLIEKGERTKLLSAITLSGYVLDVLKSIDAVGKGPLVLHGGTCGKGHEDYVPVTTGGPYLRAQKGVVSPG
ncbi:MAG: TldD/PmbA family protein [Candidatus Helarchaeota archaeon]